MRRTVSKMLKKVATIISYERNQAFVKGERDKDVQPHRIYRDLKKSWSRSSHERKLQKKQKYLQMIREEQ